MRCEMSLPGVIFFSLLGTSLAAKDTGGGHSTSRSSLFIQQQQSSTRKDLPPFAHSSQRHRSVQCSEIGIQGKLRERRTSASDMHCGEPRRNPCQRLHVTSRCHASRLQHEETSRFVPPCERSCILACLPAYLPTYVCMHLSSDPPAVPRSVPVSTSWSSISVSASATACTNSFMLLPCDLSV